MVAVVLWLAARAGDARVEAQLRAVATVANAQVLIAGTVSTAWDVVDTEAHDRASGPPVACITSALPGTVDAIAAAAVDTL